MHGLVRPLKAVSYTAHGTPYKSVKSLRPLEAEAINCDFIFQGSWDSEDLFKGVRNHSHKQSATRRLMVSRVLPMPCDLWSASGTQFS